VIKWLLRETTGLYFFFAVLAIGFTLVSIYDYAYDRISLRKRETPSRGAEPARSVPKS
jgi:4-hydroxybenzoate polyprenyltransferase